MDCKLVHIANGTRLSQYVDLLIDHFRQFGSPVMMGGDADAASKCVLAVRARKELLILVNLPRNPCLQGRHRWTFSPRF